MTTDNNCYQFLVNVMFPMHRTVFSKDSTVAAFQVKGRMKAWSRQRQQTRNVGTPSYIPYGRKFWRGIYFGGLAVLRGIRQYFIRQNLIAAQCDVIIIAKSYQCVYTRPAARHASLIVGIEFTIKSCVRGHHFSKEFCTPEVGEELACLSR